MYRLLDKCFNRSHMVWPFTQHRYNSCDLVIILMIIEAKTLFAFQYLNHKNFLKNLLAQILYPSFLCLLNDLS